MKFLKTLSLSALAFVGLAGTAQAQSFVDVTADITADTTWSNDNVYILTRVIIVTDGATLTIEPGTIIRGLPTPEATSNTNLVYGQVTGSGLNAEPGSLLIARGSQLIANGTVDNPIIFTSIDDPNVPGGAATIPSTVTNSQGQVLNQNQAFASGQAPEWGNGSGGTTVNGFDTRNYAPDGIGTLTNQAGLVGNNGFAHAALWGGLQICGKAFLGDGSAGVSGFADTNSDGIPDADVSQAGWSGVQQPGGSGSGVNDGALTNVQLFAQTGTGVARPAVSGATFIPVLGTDVGTGGGGTEYIEGIAVPTLGARGFAANYGGVDDQDSSGVIRFVQIRYGGNPLGGVAAANEINSYTTGANGSGTIAEFIENTFNQDDGTEPFGGANDTDFIFCHFIEDDSFDGDEGVRGNYQFEHALQGGFAEVRAGWGNGADGTLVQQAFNTVTSPRPGNGYDHVLEIDDAEGTGGSLPETKLFRHNGTYVGEGNDGGLDLDALAICHLNNQIWNRAAGAAGSNFEVIDAVNGGAASNAKHTNVHYFSDGVAGGNEVSQGQDGGNGAESTVPILVSTTRYTKDGYDPRPTAASGLATNFDGPTNTGKTLATYPGFQRFNTFLKGWTHLDALDVVTETDNPDRVVLGGPTALSGQSNTLLTWSVPTDHFPGTIYWVYSSTDQRNWTFVQAVQDDTAVTANVTTIADSDSTSGTVQVDLGPAPSTPTYYYVIAN